MLHFDTENIYFWNLLISFLHSSSSRGGVCKACLAILEETEKKEEKEEGSTLPSEGGITTL